MAAIRGKIKGSPDVKADGSAKVWADSSTHVLMGIRYAHHEIHAGSMFRVQNYKDNVGGSGGTINIAFRVPAGDKEPHMVFEWIHEGSALIEVLEDVTITAGTGTDEDPKNSNRNSTKESILQGLATGAAVDNRVTIDATITGGTAISVKRSYGVKNEESGGVRRAELILKTGTDYAIVHTNFETTNQGGQIRLEWYEHTPKTPLS